MMKALRYGLIFTGIFILSGFTALSQNSNKGLSIQEVEMKSQTAEAFNRGVTYGYRAATQKLQHELRDSHYYEKREFWKNVGKAEFLYSYFERYNQDELDSIYFIIYPLSEQLRELSKACHESFQKGKKKGKSMADSTFYNQGFLDGVALGFDSLANFHLSRQRVLEYPSKKDIQFHINFQQIVELLHKIKFDSKKDRLKAEPYFNDAVFRLTQAVLSNLVILFDNSLTHQEKTEVFKRYEEIHDDLSALLFQKFEDLCSSLDRGSMESRYEYRYYYSVDFFLEVYTPILCLVADHVFAYAKSSPYFGYKNGFKVMGSLSEWLLEYLVVSMREQMLKLAIKNDFKHNIPNLEKQIQSYFSGYETGFFTDSEKVRKNIYLGNGRSVFFIAEVETLISTMINTSEIQVEVNHEDQEVLIRFPEAPIPGEVIKQDYSLKKAILKGEWKMNSKKNYVIPDKYFKKILGKNELDINEIRMPSSISYEEDKLEKIEFALKKFFEPIIAIPHSPYQVKLKSGRRPARDLFHN